MDTALLKKDQEADDTKPHKTQPQDSGPRVYFLMGQGVIKKRSPLQQGPIALGSFVIE